MQHRDVPWLCTLEYLAFASMHVGAMSQILPLLVSIADNYLHKPRIQSKSALLESFAMLAAMTRIVRHSLHLLTFLMY